MWWEQHVRWWEIPSIRSITLSSDTPVNVGCCDFSSGALCVWGEKKIEAVMAQYDTTKGMTPPPLTWNSPAERVCGMSALWQEVMPVNKPWCVCVCLIEKELSSGPCDSPWSLKLHTWLFPLCHHLMHYSLIWNCYQRFPALTVTRLTNHRNLRVPSHIMTFVTTCGRFLR